MHTDSQQNHPANHNPRKNQMMIVSHIFPLLFFDVVAFEKEVTKMFFYFKSKFFLIFAEESSGRAESNNVNLVRCHGSKRVKKPKVHCRVEGRAKESAAEAWVFEIAESSTQVGKALRHGVRLSVSFLC